MIIYYLQVLFETFSALISVSQVTAEMQAEIRLNHHAKPPLLLANFNPNWSIQNLCGMPQYIKFLENPFSGFRLPKYE
jgi:hypothetical protein